MGTGDKIVLAGVAVAPFNTTLGGALQAIGGGLSKVREKLDWAARVRIETWWKHAIEDKDEDDFERTVEYELDEDKAEVLREGLHSALDAIDVAALQPLARLTRRYIAGAKPRDKFFRGCVRAFSDMSAVDVESLRLIVVRTLLAYPEAPSCLIGVKGRKVEIQPPLELPEGAQGADLMRLLLENRIVLPVPRVGPSSPEGAIVQFDRETLLKLRYLLTGVREHES